MTLNEAIAMLKTDIADLEAEIAEALQVLAPNMPSSGLVDACRQVKQVAISEADNSSVLEAKLAALSAPQGEPFDFLAHLRRQREWSGRTFGPSDRAKGVIEHIRKELNEIEAEPTDLSEWIDVAILALDGAWRAGHSPEAIQAALVGKQERNEQREWPDWRTMPTDVAIEHVRPVVPQEPKEPERGAILWPSRCGCECHDSEGDCNIEGGCEHCEAIHEANTPSVERPDISAADRVAQGDGEARPATTEEKDYTAPLDVVLERDALVIRIGIQTLAHAVTYSDWANPYDEPSGDYIREFAITDAPQFAKDVAGAMESEREDGSTPLSDFIDKMSEAAIDDGSLGLDENFNHRIKHGEKSPLETW